MVGNGDSSDDPNVRFYVKRASGKVFGPFDKNAIRMMLQADKIGPEASVSVDKEDWEPVHAVPAFADLVDASPSDDPSGNTQLGGFAASSSAPTGDGAPLPRSKEDGEPSSEPPVPTSAEKSPSLPTPKTDATDKTEQEASDDGIALPGTIEDSSGDSGPSLPRKKAQNESEAKSGDEVAEGGIDLPKLKEDESERDSSGPPDLPTPAEESAGAGETEKSQQRGALESGDSADLPRSADDNLPRSGSDEGELPRSADDNLPRSESGGTELPRSADDNLPQSDRERLPTSSEEAPAEEPTDDSGGLFAEPDDDEADEVDELFAPEEESGDDVALDIDESDETEEDLFGEPDDDDPFADDDLFADEEQEEEETGDPAEDDLFGDPTDDGLFEESEQDDLFAEPDDDTADLVGAEEENEDIFGDQPEDGFAIGAASNEAIDVRGEELEPDVGAQKPSEGPSSPEEEPLELDAAAAEHAGIQTQNPGDSASAPPRDRAEPREKARGEDEPSSQSTGAAEIAAQEARRSRWSRIALVGILLIGGAIAAYTFLDTDSEAGDDADGEPTKPRADVQIDFRSLKTGTYRALQKQVESGRSGSLSDQQEGKYLLALALFLSRYDSEELEKEASSLAHDLEDAGEGARALGRGAWAARNGELEVARAYLDDVRDTGDAEAAHFARLATGIGAVKALETSAEGGPSAQERRAALPTTADVESRVPEGLSEQDEADDSAAGGDAGSKPSANDDPDAAATPSTDASDGTEPSSFATGRDALEEADEEAPELAEPAYWLGRLHEADDQPDDALDHYRAGFERQEDHVPSRLRAGRLHYSEGALADAEQQAQTVLSDYESAAGPPESAEAEHLLGRVHVARDHNEKAIESFTRALEHDPNRPETIRELTDAYEATEEFENALEFFESNDSLDRDNPEVALAIARAHMGLQQWQAALSVLKKRQKEFPDDARFSYRRGVLHFERGELSAAKKSMQRAVKQDPTLLDAHATLAKLSWQLDKNREKSEYYIEQILRHPDEIDAGVATKMADFYQASDRHELAEQWYREALERNPNHWAGRLALVELLLDRNRAQDALELLEEAEEAGVERLDLWANLAEAYRQTKKHDRALRAINRALDEDSDEAEYLFTRGLIHFDRGNYETAIRDFDAAQSQDPLHHRAKFFIGRVALARDDEEKAMRLIRQVLDDHPDNGEYRYWMGRAFERRGRTRDALTQYKKATEQDEDYGRKNPSLFVHRGQILVKLGYTKRGQKEIRTALERDPDSTEARLALGETHFSLKNYDQAIEEFETALEARPDVAWAQRKLGMALTYQDRNREGAKHLQKAVEYGYEDPEIYRTLGYLYKDLGERQLAVESFKSFLRETPDEELPTETRREILGQIEGLGG